MSTDRPNRFTNRISELWNHRADRSPDRLSLNREPAEHPYSDHPSPDDSSDHPADRFSHRESARFRDLEPLTPEPAPSLTPAAAPLPSVVPAPAPRPDLPPSPAPANAISAAASRVRQWAPQPSEPTPRAVGAPLPTGSALTAPPSPSTQLASAPMGGLSQPAKKLTLGRGLPPADSAPLDIPSGVQRVISAVRASLPFIQRLLPLLDGNVVTVVSNLMAPPPHRPAPPPPVNLAPLEEGITTLHAQHHELRTQIADQNISLKRVEDQLEMVREATDRNTLEQQELLEDLKSIGNKVNIFAMASLLLLVVSVTINVILYLYIKRVLP